MQCIVGLGNPGKQYARTRHNIGFMVVDRLAERHRTQFRPGKGEFWLATIVTGGREALLLKPSTYMNNSGVAVLETLEQFSLAPEDLLIVFDDFHLPFGRLRLRPSGSDGGHHGLESVIYHLQTDQVPRLRCGIGSEPPVTGRDPIIEFVLAEFDAQESKLLGPFVDRAADAAESFITDGIHPAMNRFNVRDSL